ARAARDAQWPPTLVEPAQIASAGAPDVDAHASELPVARRVHARRAGAERDARELERRTVKAWTRELSTRRVQPRPRELARQRAFGRDDVRPGEREPVTVRERHEV